MFALFVHKILCIAYHTTISTLNMGKYCKTISVNVHSINCSLSFLHAFESALHGRLWVKIFEDRATYILWTWICRGLHKYVGTLETYTSILKALCGFNELLNQGAGITHAIWIISDTLIIGLRVIAINSKATQSLSKHCGKAHFQMILKQKRVNRSQSLSCEKKFAKLTYCRSSFRLPLFPCISVPLATARFPIITSARTWMEILVTIA